MSMQGDLSNMDVDNSCSIPQSDIGRLVETRDSIDSKEKVTKKRKAMKPRSEVWDHFIKFTTDESEIKAKCKYCDKDGLSHLKIELDETEVWTTSVVNLYQSKGRIIKKAFGKLKLEHVVISKGQFQQERIKPNTLEESELLALLRDEEDPEDKLVQTDISDDDLLRVMDRSDLVDDPKDVNGASGTPLPLRGPGWEVVITAKSGGVLSALGS